MLPLSKQRVYVLKGKRSIISCFTSSGNDKDIHKNIHVEQEYLPISIVLVVGEVMYAHVMIRFL
ncbi:hypothetical protein NY10_2213 [Carnobacterium antarcticum]|nr:hypothetical protein NY10_2213 [Carnobacterium sp. CP1]